MAKIHQVKEFSGDDNQSALDQLNSWLKSEGSNYEIIKITPYVYYVDDDTQESFYVHYATQ